MINATLAMIYEGFYVDALEKMRDDILKKTNGCAEIGEPDNNDWIDRCEEQEAVYSLVREAIRLLENALE